MNLWNWLFHRKAREEDLEEEVQAHLRMAAQERVEKGETPEQARASAAREFGNVLLVKETTRDMWGFGWVETLAQDVRYGMRQLKRNPGFTTVAVLMLALGIGTTTAIFSFIDAVVVRPLPYPRSSKLVAIYQWRGQASSEHIQTGVSALNIIDIRKENQVFQEVGYYKWERPFLTGGNSAEYLLGAGVSANLLKLLGVQPMLGREFTPQEVEPGHNQVALLGCALWQRQFGGRGDIIGQTIQMDGKPYTVVGVMPKSFYFMYDDVLDVMTPLAFGPKDLAEKQRSNRTLNTLGRMKSRVSLEEAQAETNTIAARLATDYPDANIRMESPREVAAFQLLSLLCSGSAGRHRRGDSLCATDRLRERSQPAVSSLHDAAEGNRRPSGAGSGPQTTVSAISRGERPVGANRRTRWSPLLLGRCAAAGGRRLSLLGDSWHAMDQP